MVKVFVVYHSGYGHTAMVARAVAAGAESVGGTTVRVFTASEAIENLDALDDADAIIFGCPTYMGSASAEFKKFMEASSRKWGELKWKDKLAAGFTNSGSLSGDKLATLFQLVVLASQHGMIWVSLGQNAPHITSGHGGQPEMINRVGSSTGVMTQSDQAPPEQAPSPGDLKTGEILGKRVAEAALRWQAGRQ